MRTRRAVAALVAAGSMFATGAVALAASTPPKAGTIRLFSTMSSGTKGKITLTGAIGDYGTTLSEDKNGKPDSDGAYTKVTLTQGTFIVNTTAFNKKLDHTTPIINQRNCSFSLSGTGPVTIGSGTGAYAGISGTATISLVFAGITPRKASGGCKLAAGPTFGMFSAITGTGHVSFS